MPINTDFLCDICGHQGSDCTSTAEVICDQRSVDIDGSVHHFVPSSDNHLVKNFFRFVLAVPLWGFSVLMCCPGQLAWPSFRW